MVGQIDSVSSDSTSRLLYIDNLRILLAILVILHHLSSSYGAPGDWYYSEEGQLGAVTSMVLTLFSLIIVMITDRYIYKSKSFASSNKSSSSKQRLNEARKMA